MQKVPILIFTLLFSFCALAADKNDAAPQTFEGTLATGVMSIGGETTGVILKMKDGTKYELDLGKEVALSKLAGTLNGKQVIVTGVLQTRQGVEVGERHIIEVTALKPTAQ